MRLFFEHFHHGIFANKIPQKYISSINQLVKLWMNLPNLLKTYYLSRTDDDDANYDSIRERNIQEFRYFFHEPSITGIQPKRGHKMPKPTIKFFIKSETENETFK